MKVACILCDTKEIIADKSLLAKNLRNHPKKMYLCSICYHRIAEKSLKRLSQTKETE